MPGDELEVANRGAWTEEANPGQSRIAHWDYICTSCCAQSHTLSFWLPPLFHKLCILILTWKDLDRETFPELIIILFLLRISRSWRSKPIQRHPREARWKRHHGPNHAWCRRRGAYRRNWRAQDKRETRGGRRRRGRTSQESQSRTWSPEEGSWRCAHSYRREEEEGPCSKERYRRRRWSYRSRPQQERPWTTSEGGRSHIYNTESESAQEREKTTDGTERHWRRQSDPKREELNKGLKYIWWIYVGLGHRILHFSSGTKKRAEASWFGFLPAFRFPLRSNVT